MTHRQDLSHTPARLAQPNSIHPIEFYPVNAAALLQGKDHTTRLHHHLTTPPIKKSDHVPVYQSVSAKDDVTRAYRH